jgi:hypothetical protein
MHLFALVRVVRLLRFSPYFSILPHLDIETPSRFYLARVSHTRKSENKEQAHNWVLVSWTAQLEGASWQ